MEQRNVRPIREREEGEAELTVKERQTVVEKIKKGELFEGTSTNQKNWEKYVKYLDFSCMQAH